MNYTEGLLRELPYVKFYGERSFPHLSSLREPDVRLILITLEPPDPSIIDWHLRDLYQLDEQQLRSARERLVLLSPESTKPLPLDALVMDDESILTRLREEARNQEAIIINFAPSATIDRLCRELDLPMEEGPFQVSRHWGDKSSGKEVFRAEAIRSPNGSPHILATIEEVRSAAVRLTTASPPAERVIIKLNDAGWGDGLGNVVIDAKRLRDTNDLSRSIESILQDWDHIVREIVACGAIVEEYFANRICSPSGQAYINPSGEVRVLSTHEQFVVADQYLGCEFPAHGEFRPRIHEVLTKVGSRLATNGVRGSFGVDFIGLEDGSLLATEINLRKVGPSHVVQYAESVLGSRVSGDGNLRVGGKAVHYSHRRIYQPQVLRGLKPGAAVRALALEDLCYNHAKGTGAILHILGALCPAGYVESTCFGFTPAEAMEIGNKVQAALLNAAGVLASRSEESLA
ncbi:MAG: peptide ligase PGM1-related protein [Actinomycetota bacterium]